MSYLSDLITRLGVENVFIYGGAERIHSLFVISYTNPGEDTVPTLFKIDESSDKVETDYKIQLRSLTEGLADWRPYVSDLSSLIDEGVYTILVKIKDPIDAGYVKEKGAENIFLFTEVHKVRKFLGIEMGADYRVPSIQALLGVETIKGENVVFNSNDSSLWTPIYSFASVNELNSDVGYDTLFLKHKSPRDRDM